MLALSVQWRQDEALEMTSLVRMEGAMWRAMLKECGMKGEGVMQACFPAMLENCDCVEETW